MLHRERREPSDRFHDACRIGRRDALRRLALVPAAAAMAAFLPTGLSAAAFDPGDLPIPFPGSGGGDDAPVPLYGEVLPGTLCRSSQPSSAGFAWLKSNGINTIVDLRQEHDDAPTVEPLGFGKYVYMPIVDNTPPTNEQAEQFLALVTDRSNWPILVHCNLGIGRAGTMSVLTRYAVQGMSFEDAYASSLLFGGGPLPQAIWLDKWARTHAPGDHPIPG